MRIRLEIDTLILEGFPAHERQRIAVAVEAELARRLAGWRPSADLGGVSLPRLDGGAFAMAPGASPEQIGARVAEAIASNIETNISRNHNE